MTMHLERIRVIERSKRKKPNRKSLTKAREEHAKFLQKMGLSDVSTRVAKRSGVVSFPESTVKYPIPTSDKICATSGKKQNTYTGTLIKGIATMHKSNAVPVINKEQASEISSMRR